ncbi:hypothetical protein [Salisediminibacterium beveridgei]|uniref:Uncharacterized protein n=1 Tax=Salisediminibacterium beveridgei TaxID=632773 RepID=A0A1D7QRL6_9BACI|nr:hypothetical protein [Salisediminibacterium beveridgei]AOM81642.1 hypothetical protein BBEV_0248 [Salisediminibacterium beveridgei]
MADQQVKCAFEAAMFVSDPIHRPGHHGPVLSVQADMVSGWGIIGCVAYFNELVDLIELYSFKRDVPVDEETADFLSG